MAYPDIEDPQFLQKLLEHNEFAQLFADPDRNFRDPPESEHTPYFKVQSHQLFVSNLINPTTEYKRLHLMWSTGSGKTIGAISIAQKFVSLYRKIYSLAAAGKSVIRNAATGRLDINTPTIFVLCFAGAKEAFVRDLLRYPEFGFVSEAEHAELLRRQQAASVGNANDAKNYKDYRSKLKKRLSSKSKDGFFKFIGYEEFVNMMFSGDLDIKLLDAEADASGRELEEVFDEYIAAGKIHVNTRLLASFENSLIICDEIHNTYNMRSKNSRGVAIQYVLDMVSSVRFVSMSATPINSSPTEIVELINYLVPKEQKITKQQFFTHTNTITHEKLRQIGKLLHGRISFLQDANVRFYPEVVDIGEALKTTRDIRELRSGEEIPYIKFIPCVMSEFHQRTLEEMARQKAADNSNVADPQEVDDDVDVNKAYDTTYTIASDSYSMYDMVFPNPDSDEFGLFRSSEIRAKLAGASHEWRDKYGVDIRKHTQSGNIITGNFLRRENIAKYSAKYAKLIDTIMSIISESNGDPKLVQKIMIYHDRVRTTGVLMIQEVLLTAGFLGENSEPVDNTLCAVCGLSMHKHTAPNNAGGSAQNPVADTSGLILGDNGPSDIFRPKVQADPNGHTFVPARFVIAHADIDRASMESSIEKFNNVGNANGQQYLIFVGSKIMKESREIKCVQNLIMTSMPVGVPTLIQIRGRCVRKSSHIALPIEQRRVKMYTLITTTSKQGEMSPEMIRYINKLSDYLVIQLVEKEVNRVAVDANINRDINMSNDMLKKYYPPFGDISSRSEPKNFIGNLYFDPAEKITRVEKPQMDTFFAYGYNAGEMNIIRFIIKRAFSQHPVWTYDDLWEYVRTPPFGVEVNPKMFQEANFIIVLNRFVRPIVPIIGHHVESMVARGLSDNVDSNRYVYRDGIKCRISHVGKFYIATPIGEASISPADVVYSDYADRVRDADLALIRNSKHLPDQMMLDVDSFVAPRFAPTGIHVNLSKYNSTNMTDIIYVGMRKRFLEIANPADIIFHWPATFQMRMLKEIIEWSISKTIAFNDPPKNTVDIYKRVLGVFQRLGAILFAGEVRKYADVMKQFADEFPKIDDITPVGYLDQKSVQLKKTSGWFSVNRLALNRHSQFRENRIVIGILEPNDNVIKFKLRKPLEQIQEKLRKDVSEKSEASANMAASTDMRLVERGIVCETVGKNKLYDIAADLGISLSDKSHVKSICNQLRDHLVAAEMAERQKKNSLVKYVYGWWDEFLDIGLSL